MKYCSRRSQCEMKFAHIREANISHLRSKYFTAKLFHLPEGQISLKKARLRVLFSIWDGRMLNSRDSPAARLRRQASMRLCESSLCAGGLHRLIHRPSRDKKEQTKVCSFLSGMAGFEPTNAGVKVPCLTAWRHPNITFVARFAQQHYFIINNLFCQDVFVRNISKRIQQNCRKMRENINF